MADDRDEALALEVHRREVARFDALNEAALNGANVCLRTLLTINGGAAVALLTFAGAGLQEGFPEGVSIDALAGAIRLFAWGVATAVAAGFAAYAVTYAQVSAVAGRRHRWAHPYVEETRRSGAWLCAANLVHVAGLLAAVGSLGLFVTGCERVIAAVAAS